MKKKTITKVMTAAITLILLSVHSGTIAQFVTVPLPYNHLRTSNNNTSVGIGNFLGGAGTSPFARLHVNQFYLSSTNIAFPTAAMFRTDGPVGNENIWSMYTGATVGTTNERFSVRAQPSTSHVYIRALEAEDEIQMRQAQLSFLTRGKTMVDLCEHFGADPDHIFIGDGTDVNTSIKATSDVNNGNAIRQVFVHGGSGNTGFGGYDLTTPPLLARVQIMGGYETFGAGTFWTPTLLLSSPADAAHRGSSLVFDRDGQSNYFFMGHPASFGTHAGDFFAGLVDDLTSSNTPPGIVDYAYRVKGQPAASDIAQGDFQFFHSVLIQDIGVIPAPFLAGVRFDVDGQARIRSILNDNALTKILVEDADGIVKYRDFSTFPGVGFGALCTAAPFNLAGDWRLGLGDHNLFFDGSGAANSVNNVIIGNPCSYTPIAKLDVEEKEGDPNTPTFGFHSIGLNVHNSYTNTLLTTFVAGVRASVDFFNEKNVGGHFEASDGGLNTAGEFFATSTTGSGDNIGGNFSASGSIQSNKGGIFSATTSAVNNIGGSFTALGGTNNNFGIYAADNMSSVLLTGSYAGVFNGDVYCTANTTFPSWSSISDSQLKTDTSSFNTGLSMIRNLHPISYKFNGKAGLDTSGTHIGVIAEDLQSIAPYAVDSFFSKLDSTDAEPTQLLSVKNEAIMYTTVNAVKELDSIVANINTSALGAGLCGSSPAGLTNNTEVPMNDRSLTFTNSSPASTISNIGLGFGPNDCSSQTAKLHVKSQGMNVAGIFDVDGNFALGTTPLIGLSASVMNSTSSITRSGVAGQVNCNSAGNNYGLNGASFGSGAITNAGVFAQASGAAGDNRAFWGIANATMGVGTNHVGGYFEAANGTNHNYGIQATASGTNSWAGWFDGNINVTGTGFFTSMTQTISDQLFKTNLDTISNALNIINQLKPRKFFFDTVSYQNRMRFSSKQQYGLVAQDVEQVLPELVSTTTLPAKYDSLGNIVNPALDYQVLNYNAFIAILMKGIKEQQSIIDNQETRLAQLETTVGSCCGSFKTNLPAGQAGATGGNGNTNDNGQSDVKAINKQKVELRDAIILDQNTPNPFSESTTITYTLPENDKGQIMFYDNNGRILKAVDITGAGELQVYAENLSNGIYTYSIVADGKTVDTKKMVKAK